MRDRRTIDSVAVRGAFLGLFLSLLCTGCGVGNPLLITDEPEYVTFQKTVKAKAWHLEGCEVQIEIGKDPGTDEWPVPVDAAMLREGVQNALAGSGIFASAAEGAENPSYPLHLSLKVVQAKGKFEGSNSNLLTGILVWMMCPLAASVVADEDYSISMKVEVTLHEPGGAEPLWRASIEEEVTEALDHFQRKLSIWDLVIPGPLVASHGPENIAEALGPHVYRKIELKLVKGIAEALGPPQVDLLVLCSGVSEGKRKSKGEGEGEGDLKSQTSNLKPGVRYCTKDVEAIASLFKKRPGKCQILRIEAGTGAEKARSILKDIALRTDMRIRDFLLFYSGPGTLLVEEDKAEAALLCYEITVEGASKPRFSTLLVTDLLKLVKQIPAASHTVVLDTGFYGRGGRALPLLKGVTVDPEKIQSFPSGKGMPCLLCACSPNETGGEYAKQKHGVLTHFLLPLLAKKTDANKDGAVSAVEVLEELSWGLSRQLRLLGSKAQHAHLSGDGVVWRYDRPAPKKEEKPKKPADSDPAKEDPADSDPAKEDPAEKTEEAKDAEKK
jgi:hypothetical protein